MLTQPIESQLIPGNTVQQNKKMATLYPREHCFNYENPFSSGGSTASEASAFQMPEK